MNIVKWLGAALAIMLSGNVVSAAEAISAGTIKSVNSENKTFVLTDSADKDSTFAIGEKMVVNRAGKESKSDLKVGDVINVSYAKGILHWTADYVLVQEGATQKSELIRGTIKSYDAATKELSFCNEAKKDTTYGMGSATVRLNMADMKIDNVKIGDHALLIVNVVDGASTLKCLMVDRTE
jgi:hypothetical protein